jgi:hypothetical protein
MFESRCATRPPRQPEQLVVRVRIDGTSAWIWRRVFPVKILPPGPAVADSTVPKVTAHALATELDERRHVGVEAGARPTGSARDAAAQAVRATTHLSIWLAFLVPTVVQMANGWRALGDNAYVSLRSFQVLSLHAPLVGTWSSASSPVVHTFYCLGPLWFWMLAIPVHLDPEQGALWGSALWCAAALSLAAEAAWRTKVMACAAVGLVVVDLLWLAPPLFADPPWNALFGLFLLVAVIALAWVVATGSLGWWPALVVVGSAAVQSHMFFVMTATALTIGAPVLGVVRRGWPKRSRWLAGGLLAGVFCWVAPVVQQVTGHPGNLTLLVTSGRTGTSAGTGLGFRTLANAAALPPIWLRHYPMGYLANYHAFVHPDAPVAEGVIVVLAVFVVGAVAWRTGHRDLATLAAVGLVCSVGLVASVALLPLRNIGSLAYISFSEWVVGIVLWTTALWTIAVVVRALLRGKAVEVRSADHGSGAWETGPWAPLTVVTAMAVVAVIGLRHPPASPFAAQETGAGIQVSNVTHAIERAVPKGPVAFELRLEEQVLAAESLPSQTVRDASGVVWQLTADGWQTGIPPEQAPSSDPFGSAPPGARKVLVTLKANTVVSAVVVQPSRTGTHS